MSARLSTALDNLLRRYVEHCLRVTGGLPVQDYDPAWPSECQVGEPGPDGTIRWRPRARECAAEFSGLEHALETPIHPDIKRFYGSYWADSMALEAEEGALTLIQVWNPDDFRRLQENIIGHAMAKRRIKAPLTVFIATTDEGETMVSVDNHSGRVVLEEPGCPPSREVSPTLAAFLDRLHPAIAPTP